MRKYAGIMLALLVLVPAIAFGVTTYTVSITQAPNGKVTIQQTAPTLSGTSQVGLSGIKSGATMKVTAMPKFGYSVNAITTNGSVFKLYSTNATTKLPVPNAPVVVNLPVTASQTVTALYSAAAVAPAYNVQLKSPVTGKVGTAITVDAGNSSVFPASALTYAFAVTNAAPASQAASATKSFTFTPSAAGPCVVTVTVTTAADLVGASRTANIDALSVANADNASCVACHTQNSTALVDSFNAGAQSANSCSSCHSDKPHTGIKNCAACHVEQNAAGESTHTFAAGVPAPTETSCVACHDLAIKHPGTNAPTGVKNEGVRGITSEFAKRSHHVTGRSLKDSDCAACHLEGKVSGSAVVIDPLYHMADAKTHLRNGNAGLTGNQTKATAGAGGQSEYLWDPAAATPDFTLMDQFCFSCHNAAGAPTAAAALTGVAGYLGTALNPFGDSVSNDYDQVSRINVVGVFEQFATANSSHHAVRGAKYTKKNLNAGEFTNISTANYSFNDGITAAPIKGTKVGGLSGTMYETGKFTATYTLDNVVMADDSVLHCGDCHTVGQFRTADVGVKPFNNAIIGAHGSQNEYLLRNSNGDDTFAKDALVCFICHKESIYSAPGQTVDYNPTGIVAHNSVNNSYADCNGNNENSLGKNGAARLAPEEGQMDDAAFQEEVDAGTYAGTGGGNIFGIKCINCHNASDKKTFGGIHGNAANASYTTYSGAKTVTGVVKTVSRKPYRFMPGLGNFRYNGGDSAAQWTVKTLSQANKQGCYTLNGASTVVRSNAQAPNPSPTKAVQSGTNVSALAIATDNGILGSWGACTDHAGTSVFGGRATTRTLLRPLTY